MASRLGAREVYLYETAEVASVAAKVLKANRARNCQLFPCHSSEMQDPPRADVVVSETLGNYALEENIIATLADARARHLKPGGIVIPRSITQRVTPVTTARIHDELTAWDRVGNGIDLGVAKAMSLNNAYVRTLHANELLAPDGVVWDRVDLTREKSSSRKGEARWKLHSATTVYGFAAWWEAELVPGISLSTAPGAPATHWEQLYFPLIAPLVMKAGEAVGLSLRSRSSEETGTHLAWTANRLDKAGKAVERQAMDLDKGFLP